MKAAKKVVHFMKGTMHVGLIYDGYLEDERETKAPIISFLFRLIGYGDSSYTGDPKDKMFVIGYCYFINRVVVS